MSAKPSPRKALAEIRQYLANPPEKPGKAEFELHSALHKLLVASKEIITDDEIFNEVLKVAEVIASFRGKGNQSAADSISRIFGSMVYNIVLELPKIEAPFSSFAAASKALHSHSLAWDRLEKLSGRAFARVQGPRSRSRHLSYLKREAWSQLGDIAVCVREPAHLTYALAVIDNERMSPIERGAAIEFLPYFWIGDDPDEATATQLQKIEEETKIDRDLLVSVMQAQIDLGLNDEFGALSVVDRWDEEE